MTLTLQQLEARLWGAANMLRGETAGQDYKNISSFPDYYDSARGYGLDAKLE